MVNFYSFFDIIYLAMGAIPQRLMKSFHIVEKKAFGHAVAGIGDRLVLIAILHTSFYCLTTNGRRIFIDAKRIFSKYGAEPPNTTTDRNVSMK